MNLKLYTGGTFDLFHYGHVNFLKHCHKICGNVVVALNTDDFCEEYKNRPIMSYKERRLSLESCPYVSEVVMNTGGKNSIPTILSVRPDFIAVGDDWCRKDYFKQMNIDQRFLDHKNITLLYIPYTRGISSSEIRQRLSDQIKNN